MTSPARLGPGEWAVTVGWPNRFNISFSIREIRKFDVVSARVNLVRINPLR